jgi:hypothetical protein
VLFIIVLVLGMILGAFGMLILPEVFDILITQRKYYDDKEPMILTSLIFPFRFFRAVIETLCDKIRR